LDVIGGVAGLALGLLALHAPTGDAHTLALAHQCGQVLLERRKPSAAGPQAWATLGEHMLTGFGHGAAGIAHALLRLAQATGESAYHNAALEALAYERALFVETANNWPDLRPVPDEPNNDARFAVAWCAGAVGIGLQRLAAQPSLTDPHLSGEITAALTATRQALDHQLIYADHVCCGKFSAIELELTAGARLGQPAWIAAARAHAAQVIHTAHTRGGYRFESGLPRGVFAPGFFKGAAGVGYTLLRLAEPEALPSVLLWE
jgi:lantibiotic modifying enzyme